MVFLWSVPSQSVGEIWLPPSGSNESFVLPVSEGCFSLCHLAALLRQSISLLVSNDATVCWNPLEYNSGLPGKNVEVFLQFFQALVCLAESEGLSFSADIESVRKTVFFGVSFVEMRCLAAVVRAKVSAL